MLLEKPQKRVVSWEGRPYKRIEYFPSRFVGVALSGHPIGPSLFTCRLKKFRKTLTSFPS
jgi:hypothetical protein